ncbi:MAG: hypothetical protein OHK93_004803 [Ramalina farinacea]|uniref:Uncharacterized protein n=1 Tax=Ramalina farinacea TaxID=258253 RepID=A0AA43TZ19_9LECA|nr:hypothetical protein [Ramalina farinacea]
MASQQLQQPPQANSTAASEYLAAIRPTAFTAEGVDELDGVDPEPQVSLPIAALKAAVATQDSAWQERVNLFERNHQSQLREHQRKEAEYQRHIAALEAANQSLTARLNQEDWTGPEEILNEDLQLVRNANIKLRAQEKNLNASLKRANLKIQNDTAKINASEKERKELKESYAALKNDLWAILARHH